MQKNRELWEELCHQAETEQDPKKLAELVKEIDRLLSEKMDRLTRLPSNAHQSATPESK
jgi:hypothetical protein